MSKFISGASRKPMAKINAIIEWNVNTYFACNAILNHPELYVPAFIKTLLDKSVI
jgi:hypothetical protein